MLDDAELAHAERLDAWYLRLDQRIYAGRRLIDVADAASFRVLADHYAIDDHHVYYAEDSYWRIVNSPMHYTVAAPSVVDRDSFEVIGFGFARDVAHVYWHNDVLVGVSPRTFVALSKHFGRDDERGYYFYSGIHRSVFDGERYLGIGPKVLRDADPRTLVVLNDLCAKDARHVYWHGARIVADAASFEVLDERFARSSTKVFFDGEPIEDCDAASFTIFAGTEFARDATRVFEAHDSDHGSWVTPIEGADPNDFVPLGGAYTLRGGHVFAHDQRVAADPASFVVLADGYARDRERSYHAASVVGTSELALLGSGYATTSEDVLLYGERVPGADPSTFRFVDEAQSYVADARHAWVRMGEDGDQLCELACGDPATLVVSADGIARSSTDVFVYNRHVPGADPESFESISDRYARDRDHVFVLDRAEIEALAGADAKSFVVIRGPYAKDAQRVYREHRVIADATPATFVPLDHVFARDHDRAYFETAVIAGADAASFETIGDGYARDRFQVYCGPVAVDGANPATFVAPRSDDIPF